MRGAEPVVSPAERLAPPAEARPPCLPESRAPRPRLALRRLADWPWGHPLRIRDPKLVLATARAYGLRWFVLQRGNRVNWPRDTLKPALETGPFTLYGL